MNKNWKREILIFTGICISVGLIELGFMLTCHVDMRFPFIISFVIESALASLIEHRLEEKERSYSN